MACILSQTSFDAERYTRALMVVAAGTVNVKTDPCPGWLVTVISPPCASVIDRLIAKPIPVPVVPSLCDLAR